MPTLPRSFYLRPAVEVARDLLGKTLVHRHGNRRLAGRIVETEAYIGPEDLACHASKGRTPRTEVMYSTGGHAYVYLIYGMHRMFNVVTGERGFPAAVLVRGLEPLEGLDEIRRRRGCRRDRDLASGPGKLCQALGIELEHYGVDLRRGPLRIEDAPPAPEPVFVGPRIGIDYAGKWKDRPLRFLLEGSPGVSVPPR